MTIILSTLLKYFTLNPNDIYWTGAQVGAILAEAYFSLNCLFKSKLSIKAHLSSRHRGVSFQNY
ncbi:hypothetical protein BpHYR1_036060 [Brachionus plicatilis]|uniref:Uncharacterized protein n=1 Tax=Brachionus plicatilis TaxID=10195 RepID=A0A3M7RYY8_BRAPC|nr:hypothetical protein BpHYR1_036060 [Brachionus plicatilis]